MNKKRWKLTPEKGTTAIYLDADKYYIVSPTGNAVALCTTCIDDDAGDKYVTAYLDGECLKHEDK